ETSMDYASAEEALEAGRKAEEGFNAIKNEYIQAENLLSELRKKQHETVTLIQKLEEDIPLHRADYSGRNTEYKEALGNAGMDEDEWKGLVESYDVKNVDEWQQDINSYNERKAAATNQYNTAKEAIEGREKPDMEHLEKERDEAEEEARTLSEKYDAIKILDSNNNEIYRGMKKLMDERIETVGISARIERLYRTVSGNMSGARMDLETYVQRNYLEQILHAANIRFREMSSGQYEFRMYDINKAGEGKNRGLDLMIYSAVTGKEREIRTLSGGESFMAALSLALGIADRIQTGSASIDLEMMFIDEGFGMLDEYSRIQAVKVLKEMAGGNKMIGIIS
ncbi:MAG: DNA repair protein, partial [Lachnospiraceae bacterium]|nr:DNA repair protein [Lachnospiraceae bacterium]